MTFLPPRSCSSTGRPSSVIDLLPAARTTAFRGGCTFILHLIGSCESSASIWSKLVFHISQHADLGARAVQVVLGAVDFVIDIAVQVIGLRKRMRLLQRDQARRKGQVIELRRRSRSRGPHPGSRAPGCQNSPARCRPWRCPVHLRPPARRRCAPHRQNRTAPAPA